MPQLLQSILDQVRPESVLDIGITALLLYWLFSLIRGTSAVRLVIGVSVLFLVYFAARVLQLRLLTQILETGAVVGLFALVVVFQPELRRALDRIGRVGSLGWLVSAEVKAADVIVAEVSRAAAVLSAEGHGALMVIERETGLEQIAETGVMIHGDLSADLLRTIFSPRSPLHDGAVIIRGSRILAAGALLPLGETTIHAERFGTRHRAALGTTEQTDALVVVVSEENGQVSLVQRARIVRNLNEAQMARSLRSLLEPGPERTRLRLPAAMPGAHSPRLAELGRAVRRDHRGPMEPLPPDEPLAPDASEPPNPHDAIEPTSHGTSSGGEGTDAAVTGDPSTNGTGPAEAPIPEPTASGGDRVPAAARARHR
ncbi:MAG TPA: diadenylate cyclase CdaA [Candidatus Limnocylindria bacterium]|nr:diadenylate cyclase CdaA [Candidatus Limnocylindria bacterium]